MKASEHNSTYKPSFLEEMCRWCYSWALVLVIPFAFINLVRRGGKHDSVYNRRRFERFGFVAPAPKLNGYLFHCVSVGEVVAASCLIKRIMKEEPDTQITITTTTPTGSARVRDIFGNNVHHFYLPYDLPMAMAGMIKRVKPKAVLITEVELWPNLVHVCWKRNIPVIVVNARMTDRSARRYAKIGKLFFPMLKKISHVCAQGKRDFKNYKQLGTPSSSLTLTNNIKFDQAASQTLNTDQFMGIKKGEAPVFVAGSTHEPEEQVVVDAMKSLWSHVPELRVVIVPRHPERFDTVAKILQENKITYVRTSEVQVIPASANCILLDEMGKLTRAYAVASFAFVGGSIAHRGGHNALEPAAFSVPVLMGPNTYNNPDICEYLRQKGGLFIVTDAQTMAKQCLTWLTSPEQCKKAGLAGKRILDENSTALDATLSCIHRYVA